MYLATHCPMPWWKVGMMLIEKTNGPMKASTSRYIFENMSMMYPIHSASVATSCARRLYPRLAVMPKNALRESKHQSLTESRIVPTLGQFTPRKPVSPSASSSALSCSCCSASASSSGVHSSNSRRKLSMTSQL